MCGSVRRHVLPAHSGGDRSRADQLRNTRSHGAERRQTRGHNSGQAGSGGESSCDSAESATSRSGPGKTGRDYERGGQDCPGAAGS